VQLLECRKKHKAQCTWKRAAFLGRRNHEPCIHHQRRDLVGRYREMTTTDLRVEELGRERRGEWGMAIEPAGIGGKLDAKSRLGVEGELIASEAREDVGLADAAVPDQHHLEQV
jgi:hypothetical protein